MVIEDEYGERIDVPSAGEEAIGPPLWSPDDRRIAVLRGTDLAIVDLGTLTTEAFPLDGRKVYRELLGWSVDGRRIAYFESAGSYEEREPAAIWIQRTDSGEPARRWVLLPWDAKVLPGGWVVADEGTLVAVSPLRGRLLDLGPGKLDQLVASPDGDFIAVAGKPARLVETSTGWTRELPAMGRPGFSPNDRWIVSLSGEGAELRDASLGYECRTTIDDVSWIFAVGRDAVLVQGPSGLDLVRLENGVVVDRRHVLDGADHYRPMIG